MKQAKSKPRARLKVNGKHLSGRSRITNDKGLLDHVDGRSTWARRFRDLCAAYVSDLGGVDVVSEGQMAIIRRIALLQVELEFQESKFAILRAEGKVPGAHRIASYERSAGHLRRLIESLNLHTGRKARDVTPPTIDEYARQLNEQAEEVSA